MNNMDTHLMVLDLGGKVFAVENLQEVASVWLLALCLTEPIPTGSKMYFLFAKAKLTSNSGSSSGIM